VIVDFLFFIFWVRPHPGVTTYKLQHSSAPAVEQNLCKGHFYKHSKCKVQQESYTKNSQSKGFVTHLGRV